MNFTTQLYPETNDVTVVIDSSGSIDDADFNKIKVIVGGIVDNITKYSKDSRIMIINFSDGADIISEFSNNKNYLIKKIKDLVHHKGQTNLNAALMESKTRINKENKNIIIVITDGLPSDKPKETINKMIASGIKFFIIGVGSQVSEVEINLLFSGQKIMIFKEYDQLADYVKNLKPTYFDFPLCYKILPAKSSIQRSSEDLNILFTIWPKDNYKVFSENEIEINIPGNDYYYGSKVVVEKKVSFGQKYVANIELMVNQNGYTTLPESIDFEIKVENKSFKGYFYLDMGLFAGDFYTSAIVRIVVDGVMGAGKSSILNLLYNNFTSGNIVDHHFFASKNDTHTTKGVHFSPVGKILRMKGLENSLSPIQNEIMEKNKIVFVDKAGIVNNRENILDYSLFAQGHYRHNIEKVQNDGPSELYECHAFIYVVPMANLALQSDIEHIKFKLSELINKAGIQTILVVTFSDLHPANEVEEIKTSIQTLPVQEKNIFFITPYINDETTRNHTKDLQGRELLKRAIEIGNQTIRRKNFEKDEDQLNNKVGKLNLIGDDNDTNTPSSSNQKTPGTSIYSSASSPDNSSKETNTDAECPIYKISVFHNGIEAKFKVPSSSTVNELRKLVEERFNITPPFILEDSDECLIGGEFKLEKILEVKNNMTNISVKLL